MGGNRRRRRSYDSARKKKIKTGSMALSHTSFAFNQDDISVCRRFSCRIQWLPSGRGRCTPYSECNSCPRPVYCFLIQCLSVNHFFHNMVLKEQKPQQVQAHANDLYSHMVFLDEKFIEHGVDYIAHKLIISISARLSKFLFGFYSL